VNGESEEDVRQTMSELPLYPYMRLEYTPLLDLAAARTGNAPGGGAQ
jgi:muconolactone delta-isomerase